MGFQTGSHIRPELGNADYSGFANAANIRAQAMSDLGAQIGGAIKEYSKKKEEKILTGQAAELLAGLPGASDLGITDTETARVAIKSLGGVGNALTALNALRQGEANVEATRQATYQSKSAFPTEQAIREQNLLSEQQRYGQRESMFNPRLAMANLGVETAQQAYDQNEAINPMLREGIALRNLQTEQATSIAAKADARADAQEARAAILAGQTQEERVQRMEIARSAEDRAVAAMYQRDPVSAKKLQSAQEYMDANDLVFVDGQLYEKSGWFNGSATRVDNPSHLRIEGMQTLRDISINLEGAQGGNSVLPPGYAIEPLDDQASGTNQDTNTVTSAALQSVAPSNPEGSRFGRFIRGIGGALDTGAQTMIQMGESAIASVPASAEYLFGEGDLSYSDAQQKYEDPMRRARIERQEKPRNQSGYFPY